MTHPSVRSRIRRTLRKIGVVLLGGFVVMAALAATAYFEFFRGPGDPDFPPPQNQAEANRQDLEYLKSFTRYDRSFSPKAETAFQKLVEELLTRADELDDAGLEMGVARAVAMARNGHTNARETAWGRRRLNSLPLRFAWFAEGLFVVKADAAQADLLGAQVLEEGGRTPQALAFALRAFVGGPDNLAHELAPHLLQSPQALHAAGLLPSPDEVALIFELQDGSRVERIIAARVEPPSADSRSKWPKRVLSPVPPPDDQRPWLHVLDAGAPLALPLRHPDEPCRYTYLDDPGLAHIQINSTRMPERESLASCLDTALSDIKRRKARYAAVDLRFNSGGSYTLTTDFTERLPQIMPNDGRIFIVTTGNTFSAAIVTVARLKYFAGPRAVLVGERPGDLEQMWAEGRQMVLPNSQIHIRFATGYHDWENGCTSLTKCYWLNFFLGVPAGKLLPAIPATLAFSDYIAGRDTALEAIKSAIQPGYELDHSASSR